MKRARDRLAGDAEQLPVPSRHVGQGVQGQAGRRAPSAAVCTIAFPREAWNKTFVVDIKPVGDGRAVLKYLAPYVHRVAISDNRIVACDESFGHVSLHAVGNRSSSKTRSVPGIEFVRGFVQHTLPPGFQKIRHYGWMSSNSEVSSDEVKWLVWLFLGWTFWLASGHAPQRQPLPTASALRRVRRRDASGRHHLRAQRRTQRRTQRTCVGLLGQRMMLTTEDSIGKTRAWRS